MISPYLYCMQCKLHHLVFSCCLGVIIPGCVEHSENLDTWLGNYTYNEQPIKSMAGYSMVMSWDLSVTKINDMYNSILNVNGQQTGFSCLNNLKGNDTTLFVIYNELLSGVNQTLRKGDTLFILSKNVAGIKTKWNRLEPILSEFVPTECKCFVFTGTNEDKNILRTNK